MVTEFNENLVDLKIFEDGMFGASAINFRSPGQQRERDYSQIISYQENSLCQEDSVMTLMTEQQHSKPAIPK